MTSPTDSPFDKLDHPTAGPAQTRAAGPSVAVVGAGLAGAQCAHRLLSAGFKVQVFDKSRGVGGRMATRRLSWVDAQGQPQLARLNHGAPYFSVRSASFAAFVRQAADANTLAHWQPTVAPGSHQPLDRPQLWQPRPGMPALCRALLGDVQLHLEHPVDGLQRQPDGWQLLVQGQPLAQHFDAVVLALPPAQAAPLLAPHLPLWAAKARQQLMLPGWVLVGVADEPAGGDVAAASRPESALHSATESATVSPADTTPWQLAWPARGPLNCIVRTPLTGLTPASAWVAHAHADWSQTHLESSAEQVLPQLQAALAQWLSQSSAHPTPKPLHWRAAQAQRWRYAVVPSQTPAVDGSSWWNSELALGACGDYLGGGGVEGAWLSGQALAQTLGVALR